MDSFDIMKASQIACCLEVSSFKPGNVHRNRDYKDIMYHHFIASGIGFGNIVYEASKDSKNSGYYIKKGVIESKKWSPTNANLGIVMLHMPIAMASGKLEKFNEDKLKKELKEIVSNTTTEDAINVYDAINIAMAGGLNTPEEGPDVSSEDAKKELIEKNLTLYDVFKISSEWDNISKEWTDNFQISFKGYNLLKEYYEEFENINLSITKTFLKILSEYPDTLISRKKGIENSKMVSEMAKEVLENFNQEKVIEFDKFLSKEGNKLNPGTTADLIASSLMIYLLDRIDKNNTVLW
ncbi:MAG: triphosphoribosyl-dephospho-CoA synthase [Methanothermococcus sp.]|jgi:triphosphoribosyl-dephospho-CoA synthase|uniref:triphosphoribosyl-dephospho-CoA synthase n=1 Tax=Methanothermococcus TaxID=155862 RepID=UPI00035C69EF|nr:MULTISPECIES: triphosphoribosyl-dephospho-CoA synthase [Methanothermococcus]MDK2790218.1 triphosphoribosyl-dephospho-CoA synthase [Methanothermococcus sp.]MDK2987179.1 triphosphoribosyl-dephospho-CoA synthase [Methanothermococcus sp.]